MKPIVNFFFSLVAFCSMNLYADDAVNEVARKLQSDLDEAIVTVNVVVDVEVVVGGSANQSQEQKIEAPGTVIFCS